jgi:hypothetical protein
MVETELLTIVGEAVAPCSFLKDVPVIDRHQEICLCFWRLGYDAGVVKAKVAHKSFGYVVDLCVRR